MPLLYIVHAVNERDSDSGWDIIYSSEVLGAFETLEAAEQLVKDLKEYTSTRWSYIKEIEIGSYPKYLLRSMENRKKAEEDKAAGKPEPELYLDLD